MKLSFVAAFLAAASFACYGQTSMPRMTSVEPDTGKAGDVLVVTGENLQKDFVAKLYLTDEKTDTQVEIVEQTPTTIKFKIPAKIANGRLTLMVLTVGKDAKYIEQPVKVSVGEPPPSQPQQ
jgi:hypothetical protein